MGRGARNLGHLVQGLLAEAPLFDIRLLELNSPLMAKEHRTSSALQPIVGYSMRERVNWQEAAGILLSLALDPLRRGLLLPSSLKRGLSLPSSQLIGSGLDESKG